MIKQEASSQGASSLSWEESTQRIDMEQNSNKIQSLARPKYL